MRAGRERQGEASELNYECPRQNLTEDSSLPLGAEIKITQSPMIQMRENIRLGLNMTPRSVQRWGQVSETRTSPREAPPVRRQSKEEKCSSSPGLILLLRTPFSHPEGGGDPRLGNSEGGKHGSHSGPRLGCSPFSSCPQAGAPWPWLQDTAATPGMTLPPGPLLRRAGQTASSFGERG